MSSSRFSFSINTFAILTAQQLVGSLSLSVPVIQLTFIMSSQEPYGYSYNTAGIVGAVLLLVGLVSGAITSPLLDRVFTNHLAFTGKLLLPAMGASWLAMIWEGAYMQCRVSNHGEEADTQFMFVVKPNNQAVLFVLVAIIGATGLTLLPVVLELGVELTRNADGSSAVLWFRYAPLIQSIPLWNLVS